MIYSWSNIRKRIKSRVDDILKRDMDLVSTRTATSRVGSVTQVMSLYRRLMDHLIRFWVKSLSSGGLNLYQVGQTCIYDDQDVISAASLDSRTNPS